MAMMKVSKAPRMMTEAQRAIRDAVFAILAEEKAMERGTQADRNARKMMNRAKELVDGMWLDFVHQYDPHDAKHDGKRPDEASRDIVADFFRFAE